MALPLLRILWHNWHSLSMTVYMHVCLCAFFCMVNNSRCEMKGTCDVLISAKCRPELQQCLVLELGCWNPEQWLLCLWEGPSSRTGELEVHQQQRQAGGSWAGRSVGHGGGGRTRHCWHCRHSRGGRTRHCWHGHSRGGRTRHCWPCVGGRTRHCWPCVRHGRRGRPNKRCLCCVGLGLSARHHQRSSAFTLEEGATEGAGLGVGQLLGLLVGLRLALGSLPDTSEEGKRFFGLSSSALQRKLVGTASGLLFTAVRKGAFTDESGDPATKGGAA